jgi:hypothetical protein
MAAGLLLVRCANPVTPDGGPKDSKPPKVISSTPPNFSTKFSGNTIRLGFNEFINLKNQTTEVFVSPRLREQPDLKIRGKDLLIKIDDSLHPATTYSITFGNAIADITENNVLEGFSYVFATGDYLDSLTLRGKVINAFDLQPQKDVFVMLYMDNNDTIPFDSLPVKVPPYYITKTTLNGDFIFTNIQQSGFKLVALGDQNSDLIFNQPNEKVAFLDSLVFPWYLPPAIKDTVKQDSAATGDSINLKEARKTKNDTVLIADSLAPKEPSFPNFTLRLFEETDSTQRIIKSTLLREGMALIVFRFPATDIIVEPLNFDTVPPPWWMEEYSLKRDSLVLWLESGIPDTLTARVSRRDSVLDTISIDLRMKQVKKKGDKSSGKEKLLTISSSAQSGNFNHFKSAFKISFSYPLRSWDFSRAYLVDGKDTLHPVFTVADSLKRSFILEHAWKEDHPCTLFIPDSLLFGINGFTNDTLIQKFRTRAARDLGNLILTVNIDKEPGQYIIQLLNEKETAVVEEQVITATGIVRFSYLTPGKFKIKAIRDLNKNRAWDTGNYRKNLQPEPVIYFPKIMEIRANWDVEETWNL